jgi:hypothetical protein
MYKKRDEIKDGFLMIGMGTIIIGLLIGVFFLFQAGKVYSKQQSGRAALAEAEYSKLVQIEEAKANLESQKFNAQSEIERARGAAEAIEIENGKLTERYIQYLYVQNLEKLDTTLIYVPTEGGLPLLEANRLNKGDK